jgi:hypothetical protein
VYGSRCNVQGAKEFTLQHATSNMQLPTCNLIFAYIKLKPIFVTSVEIICLHLNTIQQKILSKKPYFKPKVSRIALDNSISLVMMTDIPPNPDPTANGSKSNNSPFQSPFGNKPFS